MQSIALGPLVLPTGLLLGLAAFFLAVLAARLAGKRAGVDAEPQVWLLVAIGLLAARGAFVAQFIDAYLQAPLSIVDLRDGGWTPLAGFLAITIGAVALAFVRAPLRRPLAAAWGTGAAVLVAGVLALGAMGSGATRLPELALRNLQGQSVTLAAFAGKPTVVNLWATWCPPCQHEMPVLAQGQAERSDVNFVFLNQGEAAERVQHYLDARGMALRNVLLDARGEAATLLGHRALPTTLFFDAQGRLLETRVGELSRASLAQRLASFPPPANNP